MADASGFPLVISVFLTTLIGTPLTVDSSGEHYISLVPAEAGCRASEAECMTNDEFDMDSEISRGPGVEANPYNRGCSTITHCRG
ncbi:hypothetical protein F3Y22_tig00005459pilonHSYRG00323 [Hibiscus syriacus]|uniref:Uncharacterized protein n=1 Tax=Hibiscus syriacus TaxID=106335 RepID=A0A6A3CJ51_HIBSY|nr:hypothetical protein F3Y22_tig00005459pilonHSYRG00323 [Hibiscus syriacus]